MAVLVVGTAASWQRRWRVRRPLDCGRGVWGDGPRCGPCLDWAPDVTHDEAGRVLACGPPSWAKQRVRRIVFLDRTGPAVRPAKDRTRTYTGSVHLKDRLCNWTGKNRLNRPVFCETGEPAGSFRTAPGCILHVRTCSLRSGKSSAPRPLMHATGIDGPLAPGRRWCSACPHAPARLL
jgi:hypothetical protein